jgi:hypothetical protein
MACALAVAGGASGCYGSFGLTKNVHRWNGGVGGKFVQWLVFLGLVIVPVYAITLIVDALLLNSIEFWTGETKVARVERRGNTAVAVTEGGEEIRIVPRSQTEAAFYRGDQVIGTATVQPDGSVRVLDEKGDVVQVLDADRGQALPIFASE